MPESLPRAVRSFTFTVGCGFNSRELRRPATCTLCGENIPAGARAYAATPTPMRLGHILSRIHGEHIGEVR